MINQKLRFWHYKDAITVSCTKPPIMPYFSANSSIEEIILVWNLISDNSCASKMRLTIVSAMLLFAGHCANADDATDAYRNGGKHPSGLNPPGK